MLDNVPAAGGIIYTVPSPQGRSPGVGRDGRIHLLSYTVTLTDTYGEFAALSYYSADGKLLGQFTDGAASSGLGIGSVVHVTLGAEPNVSATSNFNTAPPYHLYYGWGKQDGFSWLQAGMEVGLALVSEPSQASVLEITAVVVEDYGLLGEGDEWRDERPDRAPAFLFPDADED